MAFEHPDHDALAGACGKRMSRDMLAGRDSWVSGLDSASTLGTFAIDAVAASEAQPRKKTPKASEFPPPPPRPPCIPVPRVCDENTTGPDRIAEGPRETSACDEGVASAASGQERRPENPAQKAPSTVSTSRGAIPDQAHRPTLSPGSPISCRNKHRHDSPRISSSAATKAGSHPNPAQADGLNSFGLPKRSEEANKSKTDSDERRQPPRMVPSPALHIEMMKEVPWPRATRPTTNAPAHSRTQSAQTSTTISSYFSRGSNVTFPTTAPSSQESCINVASLPIPKVQAGGPGVRRGFGTVIGSLPDASMTYKHADAIHKGTKEQEDGNRHRRAQSGSRSIMVTVEQTYSYQILEPVSTCEAIMFPRPRLRSRSMGANSTAVVTTIHAAPERVWHRDRWRGTGGTAILATRAAPIGTSGKGARLSRSKSDAPLPSKTVTDLRLQLHASMPPPVPPKDQLALSAHAATKPLPPIPTLYPWKVTFSVDRERAESVELLEAVEILELNRQLDAERQTWRHQHSSSIGSHGSPFFDRLNPCLLDPSDTGVATTLTNRRVRRAKSDLRRPSEGSVKVERLWNPDGRDSTFLVAQPQQASIYSSRRMSASTPALVEDRDESQMQRHNMFRQLATGLSTLVKRQNGQQRRSKMPDTKFTFPKRSDGGPGLDAASTPQVVGSSAFGNGRRIVAEEPIVIGRSSVPVHAEAARIEDGADAEAMHGGDASLTTQASRVGDGKDVDRSQAIKSRVLNAQEQSDENVARINSPRRTETKTCFDASQNINTPAQPTACTSSAVGALDLDLSQEERDQIELDRAIAQLEAEDGALELDAPATSKTSCSTSECSCQMCRRSASNTARRASKSGNTRASWLDEPVQRLAPADQSLSSSYEEIKGDATRECGPSERQPLKRSDTENSNLSSEAHGDFRIWEANTVDVDNLFFRPPPKRTPTD